MTLIYNLFEKYRLFRRLLIVFMCWLIAYTTTLSFDFAALSNTGYSGTEVASIIACIQVPITGLTGFLTKLYWANR